MYLFLFSYSSLLLTFYYFCVMKQSVIPILSINGSDSTGRSGIQADIGTIRNLGGYAVSAVTSLTIQNSNGIEYVEEMSPELVVGQVRSVYREFRPKAVKVGWLDNPETIRRVRDEIIGCGNIVCSPVVLSSKGDSLMGESSIRAFMHYLIPHAKLLVVKAQDAEFMLGMRIETNEDMMQAARLFCEKGTEWVLLRGGLHAEGRVTALLYADDYARFFSSINVEGWRRHGVGGSYSTAMATRLAFGEPMETAIKKAHEYLHSQIVYAIDSQDCGIRPQEIYNKFQSLIVHQCRQHHDVYYYADQLAITTRYLAQVTKMVVGKTPKQVIDDYLMEQVRNYLKNTTWSVQEISNGLGFSSPVLFARFVRKYAGKSPRQLRNG